MHPSALGRHASGAPTSMNPHNANKPQGTSDSRSSSGAFVPGRGEDSSHPPILADSATAANLWYYPPSGGPVDDNKTAQQPTSIASSSSMIGPTSTFYNPEDTSSQQQQDSHAQYQQWLDAFGTQQQQGEQQQQQQMLFDPAYQRDARQVPAQQQMQIPYDYLQGHYTSSSSISQYGGSASGTVTQSNVGGPHPVSDTTTYATQTGDMYPSYYPGLMPIPPSSSGSTPEHTQTYHNLTPESTLHSYTTTPDPTHQQQRAQANFLHQAHQARPQQPSQHQHPIRQHQQIPTKPSEPPQFQQTHAQRFVSQPNQIEQRSQASHSNPPSNHSSSLSPPSIPWSTEVVYSTAKPAANVPAQPFKVPSTNPVANRAAPPQGKAVTTTPLKRPSPIAVSNQRISPPAPSSSSAAAPERSSGNKRKRVKKNEVQEWSNTSAGGYAGGDGPSDTDSEDDDGSQFGMGGGISVGMRGLGVVNRGGRRDKGSRL
ncbi:hypothetical protein B0H34DRAFT_801454 [Crassisporium funariophilum]|nr:hypothetical protein B0H34DRAFT_801454 [Crassisporium funariophilum]